MNAPVRLVCGECLRSDQWTARGDVPAPTTCAFCGSALEEVPDADPTDVYETPVSLVLTPEEDASWWRDISDRSRSGTPETIGRFQLRELLGGGGFGQVYRAYDPRLDREVALKILKDVHPTARVMERFFREARAAAQLDHPGVVSLHDAGRDSGRCWIAYQFVAGPTLSRLRDFQPVGHRRAAEIARDLADALDHAHRRGVFHRDLKPTNVIIDDAGRARLTDFGLARRVDSDPQLTREGTVLGTPAYMSPEQAAGRSHEADARSDLYSLGVVLYELLCGIRPVERPSRPPAWGAPSAGPPRSPRDRDRSIPRELDRICRRAVAPDPADRYPDARGLALDLDRWLSRPRHPWVHPAAVAAALITGVLVGTWGWPFSPRRAEPSAAASSVGQAAAVEPTGPPAPRIALRGIALGAVYVGPAGSGLFHRPGCLALRSADPESLQRWPEASEALASGRRACRICLSGLPEPGSPSPTPPDREG